MGEGMNTRAAAPSRRGVLGGVGALALAPLLGGGGLVSAFSAVVSAGENATLVGDDLRYGPAPRETLDVYAPSGRPAGAPALPVVAFIHGGGWSTYAKSDFTFVAKALAASGFVVANIGYPLVPDVVYPQFLLDRAAALRFVASHAAAYGGDARRLFVMGHSSGAYDTVMLAIDPALRRAAGNPRLRGVVALSGPYYFLPLDDPSTIATFSAAPDKAETQPARYVRPGLPPMFLATGEDDTTVRPSNTTRLASALRKAGDAVELKTYAGIGHSGSIAAFAEPLRDAAHPIFDDVIAFLRRHAG